MVKIVANALLFLLKKWGSIPDKAVVVLNYPVHYRIMASYQFGSSPESRRTPRLLNRYWEPDFTGAKKKEDEGFSLPAIGEVSGVFSLMRDSRPPKVPARVRSSVFPDKGANTAWSDGPSRACYSAALPQGPLVAKKSHFSCIMAKELGKDGVQRVAQSATFSCGDRSSSTVSRASCHCSSTTSRRGTAKVQPRAIFVKADEKNKVEIECVETFMCKDLGTEAGGCKSEQLDQVEDSFSEAEANSDDKITPKTSHVNRENSRLFICNKPLERAATNTKTELEPFRSFFIKTFGDNGMRHVWINVNTKTNDSIKVSTIKSEAGYQLMIDPESMPLFGLFQGSLCDPSELLQDDDTVPEKDSHLCLMRVCFNPLEERIIIASDSTAMALMFWEIQSKLSTSCVYPSLDQETQELLDSFVEGADSILNHLRNHSKKKFLDTVIDLPFFTSYYYNKDSCFIKDACLLNEWGMTEDTEVIVALGEWNLSIIDKYEEKLLQSWSWNTIRSLSATTAPKPVLEFEVQVIIGEKEFVNKIVIYTEYCKYLYSIGCHIIGIHHSRLNQVEHLDKNSVEFTNKIFHRWDKLEERRKNKCEQSRGSECDEEDVQESFNAADRDNKNSKERNCSPRKKNEHFLITNI